MGREVRFVPKGWEHPKDEHGHYIPLFDGYKKDLAGFAEKIETDGLEHAIDYYGGGPLREDYMDVDMDQESRILLMMYEDTSEGTPISPAFETAEELAQWLADTGASAFGGMTASYEAWLSTIKAGSAPSAIFSPQTGFISGVEAMSTAP